MPHKVIMVPHNAQAFSEPIDLIDDAELVRRFLAATARLTDAKRGDLVGVSESTVQRWKGDLKKGRLRPLQEANSAAIRDYLIGAGTTDTAAVNMVLDELEAKIKELRERLVETEKPAPMTEGAGFTRKG